MRVGASTLAPHALVLPATVPCLFLHATYQPHVSIGLAETSIDVTLADVAVLAVTLAALLVVRQDGLARLRHGRWVITAAAVLVALALISVALPRLRGEDYDLARHAVSALKFGWYALLLPAAALLLRSRSETRLLLRSLVLWSTAATGWGLLQFLGVVSEFEGKRPGQREPSFVGIHDFAALSGAALTLGAGRAAPGRQGAPRPPPHEAWRSAQAHSGSCSPGAMTGVAGVWLALAAALLLVRTHRTATRQAVLAVAATAILVAAGTSLMRASTIERFAEFLGLRDRTEQTGVESYAHRTLLAYIGGRIWLDHPLLGVGWQGSADQWAYDPYLDDARRRFPNEPAEAFPSPERPWGVQLLYVQVLADLGILGGAALLTLAVSAVALAVRRTRGSPVPLVGLAWLCVAAGVWAGVGLIPGIPVAALTWLGLGLVSADD